LVLIDSFLPEIISQILFEFYLSTETKLSEIVKIIEEKNPLNYDNSEDHQFYVYKIKRFLTDIALGMMPSKVWSGNYDATGGYIIVKEDGEIVCYHLYDRNEFDEYLFNNTKLETASTSRHNFGKIFSESNELYFKLNLQVRFIK
jgi:hypothetical protein